MLAARVYRLYKCASPCRKAATSSTSRRRATGHNARERDTGERGDVGAGMAGQPADDGAAPAGSRPSGRHWRTAGRGGGNGDDGDHHLPDRGQRLRPQLGPSAAIISPSFASLPKRGLIVALLGRRSPAASRVPTGSERHCRPLAAAVFAQIPSGELGCGSLAWPAVPQGVP